MYSQGLAILVFLRVLNVYPLEFSFRPTKAECLETGRWVHTSGCLTSLVNDCAESYNSKLFDLMPYYGHIGCCWRLKGLMGDQLWVGSEILRGAAQKAADWGVPLCMESWIHKVWMVGEILFQRRPYAPF